MGYPGGKSGAGVYHKLIGLMPPHSLYCEPFLGGGAVLKRKRPAAYNIGVDLDGEVIARWRNLVGSAEAPPRACDGKAAAFRSHAGGIIPAAASGSAAGETAALSSRFRFLRGDGLTFLASYPFEPSALIYCDPPYLAETRSGGRIYRHEFSDEQHAELLSTIGELPCRVMISGYNSKLYASALKAWNSIQFGVVIHRAIRRTEWVWFNFPPPAELHDPRYAGANTRKRQDLKRKIASWTGKLERMPALERQALLVAIGSVGGNAAGAQ